MPRRAEPATALALALLLSVPSALSAQTVQDSGAAAASGAYDMAPLLVPIAFPDDSLPTDWASFRAHLQSLSPQGISLDELRTLQEHVYAHISADVKRRAAAGEPLLPVERDSTLTDMFAWGRNLGVIGAGVVAAVLSGQAAAGFAQARYPGSFSVRFDSMYTLIAEDDGWLVRFPHYFMIGLAQRQPIDNGVTTTIAVLSTLFADDSSSAAGASQATVAIIAAPQEAAEMAAFWLDRLGVPIYTRVEPPVPGATAAYRVHPEGSPFITEAVVFALPRGTIIFSYVGALGAFEANRPHFVDLMRSLRVRN